MARISEKKWNELQAALTSNMKASLRNSVLPYTEDDIKRKAYDAMFEATSAWCSTFAVNLRDAVYCEWWKVANSMLAGKKGQSKDKMKYLIAVLQNLSKGR